MDQLKALSLTSRKSNWTNPKQGIYSAHRSGIGSSTTNYWSRTIQQSLVHDSESKHYVKALILNRVTDPLSSTSLNRNDIPILTRVPLLAGPSFGTPGRFKYNWTLTSSLDFYWMVEATTIASRHSLHRTHTLVGFPGSRAQNARPLALQRFWKLKTVGSHDSPKSEEIASEQHFTITHFRDINGR